MIKNLAARFRFPVMVSAMLLAIAAAVYALGAATPQEALASSHVQYVYSDWNLKPSGIGGGDQFRLIFLSSDKRTATSGNIGNYNIWVQSLVTIKGHTKIRPYADGFNVVGCTAAVDARDNTATTFTNANKGVPIYWLNGNKVADNYQDFYNGSWDDEVNDKDQLGTNGLDTADLANSPWTGCEDDGTEATFGSASQALGKTSVRLGQPNSVDGPLSGVGGSASNTIRPMYGLSQVFEVIQIPGNTGTLTTGGTPRTGSINGSDIGEYWRVQLHQNGRYRIDVKGSESSQHGGTLTNPRIKLLAGSTHVKLLNNGATGVSQTGPETLATGGGVGKNSRLDIKVTGETRYYYMLIHRGAGDNGSFTLTANRLDWPQGRLAPDITVTHEHRTAVGIEWAEPAMTHDSIEAPISGYKVQLRTLPDGSWGTETNKTVSQLSHEYTGLTPGDSYEVRVRSYYTDEHANNTYQWGYATLYADDCADTGTNTCDISVNQSKKGRINYHATDDIDGHTVRLVNGRTYLIRVNGKSTRTGTLVDPFLILRRASNGNTVGSNNDGGRGLNAELTYTPTTTGDYDIVVSANITGERGTYRVKVKER